MQPPQKQKQVADRDSADRLAGDLRALVGSEWHRLHYGVAVSGGPDSMALLWLMATLLPGQVWAATVDHGLRKGSDEEARMVASFCKREHIPHSILRPAAPIRGSLQAAARAEQEAERGERAGLTPYEYQRENYTDLLWVSEGKTTDEVAMILQVSANTVNRYILHATQKLSAANRTMAIAIAIRNGII